MNSWEEISNYVKDYALWVPIIGVYAHTFYQIRNFSFQSRVATEEPLEVAGIDQIVEEKESSTT